MDRGKRVAEAERHRSDELLLLDADDAFLSALQEWKKPGFGRVAGLLLRESPLRSPHRYAVCDLRSGDGTVWLFVEV